MKVARRRREHRQRSSSSSASAWMILGALSDALSDDLKYDPATPRATARAPRASARRPAARNWRSASSCGEKLRPYHYEYVEEWLLVLDGVVVVRTPDGGHELRAATRASRRPTGHKASNHESSRRES